MTLNVTSQQNNDCVIVALANYFNEPYDSVMAELNSHVTDWKWKGVGVPATIYKPYIMARRGREIVSIPRRGQAFMSGLICLRNMQKTKRHMAIIKDGILFDTNYPNGVNLKAYRALHTVCHIDTYYKAEGR